MQYKRISSVQIIIICFCLFAAGCAYQKQEPAEVLQEPEKPEASEDQLEARDIAVFLSCDTNERTVRLQTASNGRSYEVCYNDLTDFSDRYGKASVVQLFDPGMIVEVKLSVHSKTLISLKQSADAFILRDVSRFSYNLNRGVFSMGDDNYRITEKTAVFKNGVRVKTDELSSGDTLTLQGMDRDLYSIIIDSGNGHIRLAGTEYFIGGWVQVGKELIKPVTEEMILDVPEGEYDVVITYHGRGGTKHVAVERGKETSLDVSDLKGELVKYGRLTFTVLPVDADPVIRLNGEEIDYQIPQEMEYGVYRLEVDAEGYMPIREYISVGQEMASVEIELQEQTGTSESVSSEKAPRTPSGNSAGSSSSPADGAISALKDYFASTTTTTTTTSSSMPAAALSTSGSMSSSVSTSSSSSDGASASSTGKLYIDAPVGAEVYYDGSYKGVVPCSFKKTPGTHVITLRADGYNTKTYTLTLDNSSENETYSFGALTEE